MVRFFTAKVFSVRRYCNSKTGDKFHENLFYLRAKKVWSSHCSYYIGLLWSNKYFDTIRRILRRYGEIFYRKSCLSEALYQFKNRWQILWKSHSTERKEWSIIPLLLSLSHQFILIHKYVSVIRRIRRWCEMILHSKALIRELQPNFLFTDFSKKIFNYFNFNRFLQIQILFEEFVEKGRMHWTVTTCCNVHWQEMFLGCRDGVILKRSLQGQDDSWAKGEQKESIFLSFWSASWNIIVVQAKRVKSPKNEEIKWRGESLIQWKRNKIASRSRVARTHRFGSTQIPQVKKM